MKRFFFLLSAFSCAALLVCLGRETSILRSVYAQTPQTTYAIRNARIVTVTGPVVENGTVVGYDGAPSFGSPSWSGYDIARDLAVMPDGNGYVVLDAFGGVHGFGSARSIQTIGRFSSVRIGRRKVAAFRRPIRAAR